MAFTMVYMGNGESFSDSDEFEEIMKRLLPYTKEDIDPYVERGQIKCILALLSETPVAIDYFVRREQEIPRNRRFFLEILDELSETTKITDSEKNKKMLRRLMTQAEWLQRITPLAPQASSESDTPGAAVGRIPLPYDSSADMIRDIKRDTHLSQKWKSALVSVVYTLASPEPETDQT